MERNKIEEIFFNCGRQDEMERRQNENSRTSSPKARVLQDEDKFPFRQWRKKMKNKMWKVNLAGGERANRDFSILAIPWFE